MKLNKQEAERWLKQAKYNLLVAENNLNAGFFSASCFMSEQAAQAALKAYLIFKTGRYVVWMHSIQKLAEKGVEFDDEFKKFIEYGRILDRYYIPTRYPDALAPPSVPYEVYTKEDASNALALSKEILNKVKNVVERG